MRHEFQKALRGPFLQRSMTCVYELYVCIYIYIYICIYIYIYTHNIRSILSLYMTAAARPSSPRSRPSSSTTRRSRLMSSLIYAFVFMFGWAVHDTLWLTLSLYEIAAAARSRDQRAETEICLPRDGCPVRFGGFLFFCFTNLTHPGIISPSPKGGSEKGNPTNKSPNIQAQLMFT